MYFLRKQIAGNTFVDEATSGIFEYKFSDTVEAGYDDISTITDIDLHGHRVDSDYGVRQREITTIASITGFANLSLAEQNIVGNYCAADDNTLVVHYATTQTAGDIPAALAMHGTKIAAFIKELQLIAESRYNSIETIKAVMMYLKDRAEIDAFTAAIRNFLADYKSKFHLGTQYGDSTDGIMDYIENTGGYPLLTGLDSYSFSDVYKQGWYDANAIDPGNPTVGEQDSAHDYVRDLLKNKLKKILVDGNFN